MWSILSLVPCHAVTSSIDDPLCGEPIESDLDCVDKQLSCFTPATTSGVPLPQAVAHLLPERQLADLRLVNNHWRLVASGSVRELQLPLMILHPERYKRSPGSRCRRLQYVFPALKHVVLYHHDAWCDPMQVSRAVGLLWLTRLGWLPLFSFAAP